jgi:uncharacterized protein YndB with AHSA1/START domain
MADATPTEGVVSAASDADGIRIVRTFAASREEVFRAWTQAESFARWFGEEGSTIPSDTIQMDASPGGKWRLVVLHGPEPIRIEFCGRFLELVPPERIVMTLQEGLEPSSEPAETLTVDLEDVGGGMTRMIFSQTGGNLPADEYSRAMRGELIFFERLGKFLKSRHDTGA